ncbi:MAG: hypothetical protein ACLS7Z_05705 [Christensenellales bacterium]
MRPAACSYRRRGFVEPPFAEMSAESDGEATIRYLCRMDNGEPRGWMWAFRTDT